MQNRFLIIGCGIAGAAFSRELRKQDIDFTILDPCNQNSATFISGGLLNPVTGRKYAMQWHIHELLKTANCFYTEMEDYLQSQVVRQIDILKIHKSSAGAEDWYRDKEKILERNPFVTDDVDFSEMKTFLHCEHGGLRIRQSKVVDVKNLLAAYQHKLYSENILKKKEFQGSGIQIKKNEIIYDGGFYTHLIFCDGVQALLNGYFDWVAFKPAKGECFLIQCNELPQNYIYQKGIMLIPIDKNIFWAGATNTWNNLQAITSQEGKNDLENQLKHLLKIPYRIIDHKAAIRPTIKDRSPVIGAHTQYKNVFIMNGMGTKGLLLAPYYAPILLQHILTQAPVPKEVNVLRFAHQFKQMNS